MQLAEVKIPLTKKVYIFYIFPKNKLEITSLSVCQKFRKRLKKHIKTGLLKLVRYITATTYSL